MLQLPQTQSFRTPLPVISARVSRTSAKTSILDRAIAEHKALARLAGNRDRDVQKLYKKHPHLSLPDRLTLSDLQARDEYRREVRTSGIRRAEMLAYRAHMLARGALHRFVDAKPQSRTEIARYSRYLIRAITNKVGGGFNPNVGANEIEKMGGMEVYEMRQMEAMGLLNRAVRSLARG
ncbi:hypothetical protein AB7783_12350 [Tardiphaga sp. 172_B4_N1_3]|uniref:hypothetical protein n=1 Tax=Tardiphaga sp. 172_B4_N1_3 TaxID=3240787 RepID=UPI003F89024B